FRRDSRGSGYPDAPTTEGQWRGTRSPREAQGLRQASAADTQPLLRQFTAPPLCSSPRLGDGLISPGLLLLALPVAIAALVEQVEQAFQAAVAAAQQRLLDGAPQINLGVVQGSGDGNLQCLRHAP